MTGVMTGAQIATSGGMIGARVSRRSSCGWRPVSRVLAIVVTVGAFAFIAATIGGALRPPVYSLAGSP
jgi:hypothetical protein